MYSTTVEKLFTREQKQLSIRALIKLKFINLFILNPYLRIGTGLYAGGHSIEFVDAVKQDAQLKQVILPNKLNISSGFGFNFGCGFDLNFTSKGFNNYAIILSFQVGF